MMISVAPLSEVKLIDLRYMVKTRCWGCVEVKGCERWGGVERCGETPPPWPYVGAVVVVGVGVKLGLGGVVRMALGWEVALGWGRVTALGSAGGPAAA
jgi:hypothetical protein